MLLMNKLQSVFQYHLKFIIEKLFLLSDSSEDEVFKIIQNIHILKVARVDNFSGKFLKDRAEILVKLREF